MTSTVAGHMQGKKAKVNLKRRGRPPTTGGGLLPPPPCSCSKPPQKLSSISQAAPSAKLPSIPQVIYPARARVIVEAEMQCTPYGLVFKVVRWVENRGKFIPVFLTRSATGVPGLEAEMVKTAWEKAFVKLAEALPA